MTTIRSHLPRPSRLPHAASVLLALLVVVALRLPGMGDPLGIDEGGMSLIGADWLRALADGDGGSSLYGDHWVDRPPLILALYGAAELLAGELGVRLLGLTAALAAAACAGIVAQRLAGRAAWLPAALVTGTLLSSPALDGDRTPGELLAAAPATGAMLLLVGVACADAGSGAALGPRRRTVLLLAAGALAASAPLVKQSALDAGMAIVAWLGWRAWRRARGREPGRPILVDALVLAGGSAVAVVASLAAVARSGAGMEELAYAVFGFRVDVLAALAHQTLSPLERVDRLIAPAAGSGMLVALAVVPPGIWLARRGPAGVAGAVLVAGWTVGAIVGVSGGGYFWAHYLLQLAAPVGVATGVLLARRSTLLTTGVLVTLVVAAFVGQTVRGAEHAPVAAFEERFAAASQKDAVAVAELVRRNSAPDERVAVLYARANVAYHAHREPATPYLWSSMYRALPDARARLLGALRGPARAEWVVSWQPPTAFGMDADGAIRTALRAGYRTVAVLCGKPVLVRRDRVPARLVAPSQPCRVDGPMVTMGDVPVVNS